MLKRFYVIVFYVIVNSLAAIAMEDNNLDKNPLRIKNLPQNVLYTPRAAPYSPRTNELAGMAIAYEFSPEKKSTFDISVVFFSAYVFANPGAIFAKGLLYEWGLENESIGENPLFCYTSAAEAGFPFAYERLYWAYTKGEFGLKEDGKTAEFYKQLYLCSADTKTFPEKPSYLPKRELLDEVKQELSKKDHEVNFNRLTPNKQKPAKTKSYKKSKSCRLLPKSILPQSSREKCSIQ